MLNYLCGSTYPDISIAIHQVVRFSTNPKYSYDKVTMQIAFYLRSTTIFSTFYKIDLSRDIKVFAGINYIEI